MVSVGDKKSGCGMDNQQPPREPALPLLVAGLLTLGAAFAVCGAFPGGRNHGGYRSFNPVGELSARRRRQGRSQRKRRVRQTRRSRK